MAEPAAPAPEAALAAAAAVPEDAETKVSLFVELAGDGGFRGYALNPGQGLAADFRAAARSFAAELLAHRTPVAYAAGRTPDAYEVAWLPIGEVGEIAPVIARAEASAPMELFNVDSPDAKRLRLSVVSVRAGRRWIHFVRETSIRSRLSRGKKIAAVMGNGAYDRLESDVLLFDTTFDAVVSGGVVFLVNQRQFERGAGFVERAGAAARETLTAITKQLRIKGLDGLIAAAGTDTNMIAKLRGIQAKIDASADYAAAMTMLRLVAFVKSQPEMVVDLDGEDGKEEFVFYPDTQRRWRILKLLDDDYLHSQLTEIDYEANSKTVLK